MGKQLEEEDEEKSFHVLAVDDSVIDRKLLERLLTLLSSCKVTCVESGDKALKYLGLLDDDLHIQNACSSTNSQISSSSFVEMQGLKVNMIMTDYCMPGMSGYDLLKRLKGSSNWKDVPVVVMSSENVPSRINMCLEGGAEEFLLKPLQLSDLKKLEPYFLKSLDNSSSSDQECANISIAIDDDDHNNCTNSFAKRKALSPPEPPKRSRPNIKGLAVL
ncbi:two-component response regulator ORR9-like [Senna tora]|uniref:Two-component response regulator ORR9-like n=1 Tax=Senna tora TaxID=362788 RepID=A0A834T6P0_9FABA|nr:two-component response regulator ORR9-like [Senna tora]